MLCRITISSSHWNSPRNPAIRVVMVPIIQTRHLRQPATTWKSGIRRTQIAVNPQLTRRAEDSHRNVGIATGIQCASSSQTSSPVSAFQMHIDPFSSPLASREPSGEYARQLTSPLESLFSIRIVGHVATANGGIMRFLELRRQLAKSEEQLTRSAPSGCEDFSRRARARRSKGTPSDVRAVRWSNKPRLRRVFTSPDRFAYCVAHAPSIFGAGAIRLHRT